MGRREERHRGVGTRGASCAFLLRQQRPFDGVGGPSEQNRSQRGEIGHGKMEKAEDAPLSSCLGGQALSLLLKGIGLDKTHRMGPGESKNSETKQRRQCQRQRTINNVCWGRWSIKKLPSREQAAGSGEESEPGSPAVWGGPCPLIERGRKFEGSSRHGHGQFLKGGFVYCKN